MIQRHIDGKQGEPQHPRSMANPELTDRDRIRPYPWPRARYNEWLNNRTVYSLATNFKYGNADAALRTGLYHRDPRPALTIQNLIVPSKQTGRN
jgi:hypothetical protein